MEIELKLGGVKVEVEVDGLRGTATLLGLSALAAAVVKELRTPPERRSWRGSLLDVVPYDLRPPTPRRLRAALWDPSGRDVLVPTAFGVGWTVNLAALAERCGCRPPREAGAGPTVESATPPTPA